MKRIICVGNRYLPEDAVGPRVFDLLAQRALPADVEAVDGGLAGIDLVRFVEGADRVVFVDRVVGFGRSHGVVVLEGDEAASAGGTRYGHGAGLTYLLRVLPELCDGKVPEILLVGVGTDPDEGILEEAAALSLMLASFGGQGPGGRESVRSARREGRWGRSQVLRTPHFALRPPTPNPWGGDE